MTETVPIDFKSEIFAVWPFTESCPPLTWTLLATDREGREDSYGVAGLRDTRLCLVFPSLWETSVELGARWGAPSLPLKPG